LLQEGLQQGRHGAKPKREYKDNMFGILDRSRSVIERSRRGPLCEFLHRPQGLEVERCDVDQTDIVSGRARLRHMHPRALGKGA
jgi:hypothetical protein